MKKIICLALVLLVVLSLTACGSYENDSRIYFFGTWSCEADKDSGIPASTMVINEDNTGTLQYGDVHYTFKWVNHPSMPEILLVKEMVDDNSGTTHLPTEKLKKYRCPNCYLETYAIKVSDQTCPKTGCNTVYPDAYEVSNIISCTYTVYQGKVRVMVMDGDGLDQIDRLNLVLDKQAN